MTCSFLERRARRLQAHPVLADALAAAQISASWARQICDWTGQLPADHRADADQILLAAALGGADLHDLGALLGGWLGNTFGLRTTLAVGTIGLLSTSMFIILSPVRHVRALSDFGRHETPGRIPDGSLSG